MGDPSAASASIRAGVREERPNGPAGVALGMAVGVLLGPRIPRSLSRSISVSRVPVWAAVQRLALGRGPKAAGWGLLLRGSAHSPGTRGCPLRRGAGGMGASAMRTWGGGGGFSAIDGGHPVPSLGACGTRAASPLEKARAKSPINTKKTHTAHGKAT